MSTTVGSYSLPVITFEGYERLCAEERSRSDDGKSPKHRYFVVRKQSHIDTQPLCVPSWIHVICGECIWKEERHFYLFMSLG
jgi:hypothetical protein